MTHSKSKNDCNLNLLAKRNLKTNSLSGCKSLLASISLALGFEGFIFPLKALSQTSWNNSVDAAGVQNLNGGLVIDNGGHLTIGTYPSDPPAYVNAGTPTEPATASNGTVKVQAGGKIDIKNNGSLNINAAPPSPTNQNYPTLQIGTTSGSGAATVSMDHGNLNIPNGEIQVGDLVGATSDPKATGGGDASLSARDSHITGGLQIGTGGNKSSSASLKNTTYNDNGNGVIVGINGDNNTYTQSGGSSNISGGVTVGYNPNSSGKMDFNNGAKAEVSNGLYAGLAGKGTVNISNGSSVNTDTLAMGLNQGSSGIVNVNGKSNVTAGRAIVGDHGTGDLNIGNGNNVTIGDPNEPSAPEDPNNGYVKVGAGSNVNITDGSSLTIQAQPTVNTDGTISNYPTLQIGTNQGAGTATVNVSNSSINVANGEIQVGDLVGATNNPETKGGGPAVLNGNHANITGGLQIGTGGNESSKVNLTNNSNYNDNGNGVIVGINGKNNTYSQSGGTMTVSGLMDVGENQNSSGVMALTNGASAKITNILTDGVSGDGTVNVQNSSLQAGAYLLGANDTASGKLNANHSTLAASTVIVGYNGKGVLNIKNGSTATFGNMQIGSAGTGTGTVSIDGSNVTVGDANEPAAPQNPNNGYVKVGAGSTLGLSNGSSLNIEGQPTVDKDGNLSNYPTLQIGTNQGAGTATVNVSNSSINVANGEIQVGDLVGATNNPEAKGGGPAVLNGNHANITGGLQIGTGGNESSKVNLTNNSNYNDNGNGVIVGINGKNNTYSQSGGTMTVSGLMDVGENQNSKGEVSLENVNTSIHGLYVGVDGIGDMTLSNSNAKIDGFILGTNNNSSGTLSLDNHSTLTSNTAIIGYYGEGTLDIDHKSSANFGNMLIGSEDKSGTGTAFIDNKSSVHVSGITLVGTQGTGTLDIQNGSTVTTGSLSVGNSSDTANGEITVDNSSHLIVGANGQVTRGNQFYRAEETSTPVDPDTIAIIGNTSDGSINVASGELTLNTAATIIGNGDGVKGSVDMQKGSTLFAQGDIVQGHGTATMSFEDAQLTATGNLYSNVNTSLKGENDFNTNGNIIVLSGQISDYKDKDGKLIQGGFNKNGNGTLEINGNNSYTGATNLNEGILQGVGTIGGDLNIASGTTLRPGQSSDPATNYGTMTVNGNTTMNTGSTFEANVAGAGKNLQSSILEEKGSFTIQNGTNLTVNVERGAALTLNQDYKLIQAAGGIKDANGNIITDTTAKNGEGFVYKQNGTIGGGGDYDYGVLYSTGPSYKNGHEVDIQWLFDAKKGLGWNGDRNQTGTGDRLAPSVNNPNSPLHGVANALAGSDNEQRLHNLTQMDGEIASDMRTGNINSNFWIRDSVNNRLDCLEDTFRQIGNGKATSSNICGVTGKKVNVWGNMYGGIGGQNGHSGWNYAAKARDNDAGFIWGVDGEIGSDGYAEDRWHVGMMMGYGSVMESASGVSSSGESNNANIGMYFGKQVRFDNQNFFTFHGQFGYTWNIMSWHRSVDLEGAAAQYNQNLHANELGGTAHINAEIAYKHVFNLWGTPLEVAPTGSITYLNYEQGSYHETGGNLALHGAATNTNLGYGFMGAKLATNFNLGTWVISPHGKFGYRRSFGANQSYTHTGFEALGSNTDGLSIVGVPVVQDQALTELGFDIHPTEFFSFGANYVGLYGGHSQTMSGGQLSAKIAF